MKIRICSDLHVDINKDSNFGFRIKPDYDALLIAGDIAGDYSKEYKFLNSLYNSIKLPIYVIAGNHLGYDYSKTENIFLRMYDPKSNIIGTKQWSINYLKKNLSKNIHYLDNDWIDLGNYTLFGGTLYSDYKLYENEKLNKDMGLSYLNDFRYVHEYFKKENVIRPIHPDDYVTWFNKCIRRLNKCYKETEKDIIVMTHFTPSIRCISGKYLNGNEKYLNASYASNLDDYIIKHPRIKYWIAGHCHNSKDFMIEQCRVIMNPYGYFGYEQKRHAKKFYGQLIEI